MSLPELTDLLINRGTIITMDPQHRILDPGYILVHGGRIVDVGAGTAPVHATTEIDATDMVVLPGIVNVHDHLDQSMYRSCLDEIKDSRLLLMKMAKTLTRERANIAARLTLLELVRYGVTTTQESHWTHFHRDSTDGICDAVAESGMRAVVARSIVTGNDRVRSHTEQVPDGFTETVDDVIRDLERLTAAYESDHIRITPEAITVLRCSEDAIIAMREWAIANDKIWHMHLAQDREELADSLKAFGCGSVQYASRLGVLGPELVAVHCSGLLEDEVLLLGESATRIAHCPATIMRLGGVVPPIWKLEELGAIVGIGTDGSATNNGQNPWEAMKSAVYLQRVRAGDRYLGSARRALEMATIKAAAVLGMDQHIGSLEAGKWADIAAFRKRQVHLVPHLKLMDNLVYSGGSNYADTVIVGGDVILKNGRSTMFDEDEVIGAAIDAQMSMASEVGLNADR